MCNQINHTRGVSVVNSVVVASEIRLQEGAAMIRACQESGLSVRKWLEVNHISRNKYFYWKRKLKDICLDQMRPTFIEVPQPSPMPADDLLNKEGACASIQLGTARVELYSSATEEFLERLIKAVSHAE